MSFFRSGLRKCRVKTRCTECTKQIHVGEKYTSVVGKSFYFYTLKVCVNCTKVQDFIVKYGKDGITYYGEDEYNDGLDERIECFIQYMNFKRGQRFAFLRLVVKRRKNDD